MSDLATTAAVSATAGGATAAMAGWPPQDVILWAVIGGLVSVWASRAAVITISARWLAGVLAHIGVSAASGIALSAGVLSAAPAVTWISALATVPQWVMAGVIAALIHSVAPLGMSLLRRWAKAGGVGGNNVQ